MSLETYWLTVGFLFGTIFGSFLNAVIYRLPIGKSLRRPSRCPECDQAIRWYHNVPLFGWVMLRGRCRDCGARISARYPFVELISGLILAGAIAGWGLSVSALSITLFGYIMIVLAFIDIDHRILPNVITLPGTAIGLALSFFDPRVAWTDAFLGALLGGGLLYGVAWAYLKARGREGMGMGDIKMMLLVGAFLGWRGALMTIFLGSLIGSIVGVALIRLASKEWEYALPFGAFLAAAGVIASFWGPRLLDWYLRLTLPA